MEHFDEQLTQTRPEFALGQHTEVERVETAICEEVARPLKEAQNGERPGSDGIPMKLLMCDGPRLVQILTASFNKVDEEGIMPIEWKVSHLFPIYKRKGNMKYCGMDQGIALMSSPAIIFSKVVKMEEEIEPLMGSDQAGFHDGRSCPDKIFLLAPGGEEDSGQAAADQYGVGGTREVL